MTRLAVIASSCLFLVAAALATRASSETPGGGMALPVQIQWHALPASGAAPPEQVTAVSAVLDDFHAAAAAADGDRYFAHFAPNAVFLGTDSSERWDVAAFRAYAEPYFSQGRGWKYVMKERHVAVLSGGRVAFFDERLDNEKYGEARGSGALVLVRGTWKIAHYDLTFPIPNEIAGEITGRIREFEGERGG